MKNVNCNKCGHQFKTKAQDKNIRCPKCKSKESFGYILRSILIAAILIGGCSESQLQKGDDLVQDVNTIAQGGRAVLESPAGQMIPPVWKLYGVLGIALANGLVIGWEEWRNRTMKKTTRAIVKGIENTGNPDKATSEVKSNIAEQMRKQGGDKFYARANKIVDRLKIS